MREHEPIVDLTSFLVQLRYRLYKPANAHLGLRLGSVEAAIANVKGQDNHGLPPIPDLERVEVAVSLMKKCKPLYLFALEASQHDDDAALYTLKLACQVE